MSQHFGFSLRDLNPFVVLLLSCFLSFLQPNLGVGGLVGLNFFRASLEAPEQHLGAGTGAVKI